MGPDRPTILGPTALGPISGNARVIDQDVYGAQVSLNGCNACQACVEVRNIPFVTGYARFRREGFSTLLVVSVNGSNNVSSIF